MQIEMTIKGLMVDPATNTPIVILKDKEEKKVLPIWVGVFEANAIALQIANVAPSRPMTHDLLLNVISCLDGTVTRVVICDLKESTFFALIQLEASGTTVSIDARPSDALALALRVKAPIYAEDSVIEGAKTLDSSLSKESPELLAEWLERLDPKELGKYKM